MERCSRCIMPATAKGIRLDGQGMCQLCREHRDYRPRGERALREMTGRYAGSGARCDCIVPLSGGRDSSFALFYAKRVLGLRPIAVHYDNDFETETATRNLENVTRSLEVPLVRISSRKGFTRKVVAAKIRMNAPYGAGLVVSQICEACQIGFESASYNLARRNGIELILWGDSRDESTKPYHDRVPVTVPSRTRRLLSPHGRHLLAYRYYRARMQWELGPHSPVGVQNVHLFDFIRWDRKTIVETISRELGWSAPEDSPTTWRVDCSLVPVVNYLTEQAYGVSKIELGFSSMIRNGKMDRDDALRQVAAIKQGTDVGRLADFLRELRIGESVIDRVLGRTKTGPFGNLSVSAV